MNRIHVAQWIDLKAVLLPTGAERQRRESGGNNQNRHECVDESHGRSAQTRRWNTQEKCADDPTERFDGFCSIDVGPQVRAVLEALRVPGPERPKLVDHPAIVSYRGPFVLLADRCGRRVPESIRLVHSFRAEQFDVIEQEPATVF
jgi:hypothetical protein